MAGQHNELRRGELSAAVKKALGDSRGGGIERYSETLTPVLDPWSLPEWAFLRGERLAGGRVALAAGAATELGQVALVSPIGLGYIVVVEQATVDVPVATQIIVQMGTEVGFASLTTVSGGANVDTRWANVTEPIARMRSLAFPSSALGVGFWQHTIPALTPIDLLSVPVVLHPGFGINVCSIDDAAAIRVSYRWRERKAYTGELV
jgi:hypothetical protein